MDRRTHDLHVVVAELLNDARFLTACCDRDIGALFRLLNHRGISTRRIAAAADITQGRLYDYMNGKSRVEKLSVFEQISDAFHIPGELLGLAKRAWEPAAEAVEQQLPAPPDGDDLSAMNAFRVADRQAGGGRLYGAVVRHLSDQVAPRLVGPSDGPQVFAAASALTEMAGWMAHDSGRDDRATGHFTRALSLARVSGDLALAAHITASSSYLTLHCGDAAGAVHWAEAGLRLTARTEGVHALTARLHTMRARALAAATHHRPAARALEEAERALANAAHSTHPWLSPFDAAALASESALVWWELERYDEALAHAEDAVRLREEGRARSLALSRIALAGIHAKRGELDAAVAVGHGLLATGPSPDSVRVVHELTRLISLLQPYRSHGPVREYLTRLNDVHRTRMLLLADVLTGGTT